MPAYDWRNDPNVGVTLSPDQVSALANAQPWQGGAPTQTQTIPGGGAFVGAQPSEKPPLPPGNQGIISRPGGGGPALSPSGNPPQSGPSPATPPGPALPGAAGGGQAPSGQGTNIDEMLQGPEAQQVAEEATQRAKNASPEAKQKISESDFDWEQAWKEMSERFGSKIKMPDLKSKEEKGLWMMDFGFRMMAAASTGNFFTAAGVAGVGANEAQQQRFQSQRALAAQDQRAGERAALTAIGQKEGAFSRNLERQRGDIIATEEGYVRVLPDGSTKMLTDDEGNALKPFDRSGKGGKYAAELQLQWLLDADYSFKEAVDILNGASTPAEMNAAAVKSADAQWSEVQKAGMAVTPPGGSKPKLPTQWTDEEIRKYKANRAQDSLQLYRQLGAQSGSGALGTPPPDSARPGNEWGVAPGTVDGDYEYVGGDPSQQSSWKKRGT